MRTLILMPFLLGALANGAQAQEAKPQAEPSIAQLGKKIPDLSFHDAAGKQHKLSDLKDTKAIVVVFVSFDCPVSNSYSQPLSDLAKVYGKRGVHFIGLTVNEDDTRAQVAKQANDWNLGFPVYRDEGLVAAKALKADVTPECFVLDHNFVLRYRGRIDDSYQQRLKKHDKASEHNLDEALAQLLAGRPVYPTATKPIGCFIPREPRAIASDGAITYHRDVVPILQKHCQSCHRPGEVGPFSLMTYKQAVNWADDIKSYTQSRQMPPWKISAGLPYHNDRRMSDKEIATLALWVEGGCPEGNAKDAPQAKAFPEGWQGGTPDLILTPSEEFQLGPDGRDLFRCFVMPTNLPEDVYVAGVEVRPSNPRVVHHVLLFVDGTKQGRKLEADQSKVQAAEDPKVQLDRGPGYTVAMGVGFTPQGGMGGWAPGNILRNLPEGSGHFLPKGADIIMQVHFHRNGRLEKDRTQVGLYFAKKDTKRVYQGNVLAGSAGGVGPFRLFFSIPAGADQFKLAGDVWAKEDFNLYSVMPHMHMLGKQITVTMTPPDGSPQTLLAINDWDYNWQETYMLKEPLRIRKGTKISVESLYDNSSKNPRNPFNPPRRITFGEQTDNEMCFVFLGGLSDRPGRALPLTPFEPKEAK